MAQFPPGVHPQPAAASSGAFPLGGILATAGAVVGGVSVFLPWETFEFGFGLPGIDVGGIESVWGIAHGVAALAALVLGILAITLRTRGSRKGLGMAAVACGAVMLATPLINLATGGDVLAGSPSLGMFVAVAAGGLVAAGGALAMLESRKLPEAHRWPAAAYQQPQPQQGYYPQQGSPPPPGPPPAQTPPG